MSHVIDLKHIFLAYGPRPVLNDISFSVYEKEFFIVIGPNASGKTTLVKTISGVVKPQKGDIKIIGQSLSSFSRKKLARHIAVVPQTAPDDIPFSVAEVVLLGRSPHLGFMGLESANDLEIAEQAMSFTNVSHLSNRRMDQLSGGERQRVLIARAICQKPKIIVLDEPTAALDLSHQIHIMDLMEQLRCDEGITVVMVSHDLNLAAMYADRMLLMKNGSIVKLGHPSEVMSFEILEKTYECVLLVDENPLKKVPRVIQAPRKLRYVSDWKNDLFSSQTEK